MKVDRLRLKKSASDIPAECQILIDKLRTCSRTELQVELSGVETWTFGKCELYHWIDVLDIFDVILEEACARQDDNEWALSCDLSLNDDNKKLLLWVLHFTTLLIEHSFSRHLYNSMEHLVSLLSSSDMQIVLGVLNLLYMFSKRSNFITRLNTDKRQILLVRLFYLAESWGGKDNGFGLADCCKGPNTVPQSASTLHFEFYEEKVTHNQTSPLRYIHMENVDKLDKTPASIMNELVQQYRIPQEKQMRLFTQLRLACCFADYKVRMYCVQARLQALSVLVYSNALTDNLNPHFLLYNGLLEELVELLKLQLPHLVEIRSAALRTLTSIIHLDRSPTQHFPNKKPGARLKNIIDVTGASSYHGFLPTLVRSCISTLIGQPTTPFLSSLTSFPLPLATALFSFLYHLASYDAGGKALKSCGMMEALLRVIKWPGTELDHITFVTRAVRVIDLITNIDMQAFQTHGGLNSFISRLNMEINYCRTEQPFEIVVGGTPGSDTPPTQLEDIRDQLRSHNMTDDGTGSPGEPSARACLPQRAALLKSMLNFLKKAIQEATFAESIRHVMEGTLPSSLKHIISNAEYYGPSLFLLATDVVTVYVFQEPSLLSSLQDNGLTDVVLHALLIKEVPATREVLASLPNVFSALCLNTRGLDSFVRCRPFDRLFKVLLSPSYLTAMRRRRSADPMGDTATNLGNAMDELMRHQPTLKVGAMTAIISLLSELCFLGNDPKYVCWRAQNKCDASPAPSANQASSTEGGSSDEEEDDEEEASTSSHNHREESTQENNTAPANNEKTPIALVDYIVNVTKFVDAILSNNSTDDHCKEFVAQEGLDPLLRILSLPNLPVDYPVTVAAQSVASVCKSILNLAHEPKVLKLGLSQLLGVLDSLKLHQRPVKMTTGSVLLHELASAPSLETAFSSASATPLLHAMGAAHGYVVMFVHVCRTGQSEIRNLSLQYWGSDIGLEVLRGLAELYTALVWESTLLLALCSDDIIPEGCDFGREDMEKLVPPEQRSDDSSHDGSSCSMGMTSAMEALTTIENLNMDIDQDANIAAQSESREERSSPTSQQLKYIKPLLGASSRLGRALAELFGLLVKLCVGTQARNRRGQNNPTSPAIPTGAARRVATALSILLARGMSWDALPPLHISKFRLTFLICSVGFTSPMLFDEKRYPYHLMLYKFMNLGGQTEFFSTFNWAITGGGQFPLEMGFEHPFLPDGTGEFLDVWLMLLEKMVNPTAILESPHVCSVKNSVQNTKTMQPPGQGIDFDPLKYLINIQKLAFESVMLMWGRKPLKTYGARMTESMLTIFRHILQGEKIIRETLSKKSDKPKVPSDSLEEFHKLVTSASTPNTSNNIIPAPPAAGTSSSSSNSTVTVVNNPRNEQINQEHLQKLVDMGFSMELCAEALLNSRTLEQATEHLLNNPHLASRVAEMELGEDDQIVKAIAMSLGELPSSSNSQDSTKEPIESNEPLSVDDIHKFAMNMLPVCLDLLDQLPDSVYSICELIFALVKRNGSDYRDDLVNEIVCEIVDKIFVLLNMSVDKPLTELVETMIGSPVGAKVAIRLHLLALLIDSPYHKDMKVPCGLAINKEGLLQILVKLLVGAEQALTDAPREIVTATPKWLTPLLLVLDLTDKVAVQTSCRVRMHDSTLARWQWYDMSTGKWNTYSYHNSVIIDSAYWKGEATVRVSCGRRRYTLQFADMVQVSDETGNTRPVMMALLNMTKNPKTGKIEDPEIDTNSHADARAAEKVQVVTGMDQDLSQMVTRSCVRLMRLPLDIETLHAVMRMLLRCTRDFTNAKLFAEEGGVKLLLNLTLASNFTGFEIIATLLIRHVFEGPALLEATVEKIIRAKSASNFPPEYRELIYLSRHLGAAIARDNLTFTSVAARVWVPDTSIEVIKRNEDNPPKEIYIKAKSAGRHHEADITEKVTIKTIADLMIALTKPDIPNTPTSQPSSSPGTSTSSTSKASGASSTRSTLIPRLLQTDVGSHLNDSSEHEIETLLGRKSKETPNFTTKLIEDESRKPLIRKSDILKILSDAVRSYTIIGKYITYFIYKPEHSEMITEEMTAMTFLLDKLLPSNENACDPDRHALTRMLISSIAACHQMPETQLVLIWDVRNSLLRAVNMPESAEKHVQMQMLASLVSTIIEHCPPLPNLQMKSPFQVHPLNYLNMNHMIRLILRRGIVADLARFTHCVDLSSPHLSATVNAALKPLDILTRVLNQPIPHITKVARKSTNGNDGPSLSHSIVTGSEATHAQRDDAPEDGDNTEADLSTAGESLGGRVGGEDTDGVEAAIVDIMGQLLDQDPTDRSGNGGTQGVGDSMDIDEVTNEQFLEQNDTEESESESHTSGDDEDEDDDDNEEENGRDGQHNNEESSAYEEDTEPETEMYEDDGQDFFRMIPGFERDTEDILMIQYSDQNSDTDRPSRRFQWTSGGFTTMPFGMQIADTAPPNHPLLINRHHPESVSTSGSRGARASRQRRYQYLQMNPLSANPPPIILQRLLGPISDPNYSPISIMEDAPRVVIMDHNFGLFNNEEEQIDVVDQSGYLLGPNLSNGWNNIPIALHWWNEEARMCDGSAILDYATHFCNMIYPSLEQLRFLELSDKKHKRFASEPVKSSDKSNLMETNAIVAEAPEIRTVTSTALPTTTNDDMSMDLTSGVLNMISDIANSSVVVAPATTAASGRISSEEFVRAINSSLGISNENPIGRPPPLIRISGRDQSHSNLPRPIRTATFECGTPYLPGGATPLRPVFHFSPTMQLDSFVDNDRQETMSDDTIELVDDENDLETRPRVRRPPPLEEDTILLSDLNEGLSDAATNTATNITTMSTLTNIMDNGEPIDLVDEESRQQNSRASSSDYLDGEGYDPDLDPDASIVEGGEILPPVDETVYGYGTTSESTMTTPAPPPAISDLDLPEDVDPSFLAALPEEMRAEVIAEQLRLQRLRRRNQQELEHSHTQPAEAAASSTSIAAAAAAAAIPAEISEVSPDFLAALPPAIQEEVLAQQRLEQQRQIAATANPNDPVDAAAFFQNLQPSLRQAILTDMEESQISVLPPELAAEAQNLRRDWEARNRQLMQERFLSQITHSSNALSSILRTGRGNRGARYTIHSVTQRSHWNSWGPSSSSRNAGTSGQRQVRNNAVIRVRGKQLLDLESISCLLVLLFQNDPKLTILRFHRVIRNLCYHGPTREWVIKALLSILDKCVNAKSLDPSSSSSSHETPNPNRKNKKGQSSKATSEPVVQNWLNINLDAALGCKTNVFCVVKHPTKKGGDKQSSPFTIAIHPQAAPIACRQTLDLLITLAKSFPSCFLPLTVKAGFKKKTPSPKSKSDSPDFWEILLKLDSTLPPSPLKKFKIPAKTYTNIHSPDGDWNFASTFESSGFGQLLAMMETPLIKKNVQLVDKFLRLLSMITRGLPELTQYITGNKHMVRFRFIEKYESIMNYEIKLRTVISIITWKCCSEDGLEYATLMLLNLSHVSSEMRKIVINLLWYGAFVLSRVVDEHIRSLLKELRCMKKLHNNEALALAGPSGQPVHYADDGSMRGLKRPLSSPNTSLASGGIINDRFTKEPIIVTASNKQKATCDLQLSSMSQLISKTSSQVYFLKLLRVIFLVLDAKKRTSDKDATNAKPESDAMDTGSEAPSTSTGSSGASCSAAPPPASSTQGPFSPAHYMDSKAFENKPLSAMLNLGTIWTTLSQCLLELEHTPDHHAVLVLQPAVEAFFLVHTPQKPNHRQTYIIEDVPAAPEDSLNLSGLSSVFETATDDVPTEENNVIVPPLSPIHVDNVASDLMYSSDSDDTRTPSAFPPSVNEESNDRLSQAGSETASDSIRSDNYDNFVNNLTRAEQVAYQRLTTAQPPPGLAAGDLERYPFWEAMSIHASTSTAPSDGPPMDDQRKFVTFAERHRTVLNQILRQSTGNLADGPFAVLVDHTRILDFDVKRRYFRSELERLDNGVRREELAVHVRRSHVFEDSFRELYRRVPEEWKNRFYIVFEDEEGQDAGGLLREWYMIISRDIFNPMYALFTVSPGDRVTYMINSSSYCNPNHLCYYKFVGRVIAKAIYDNKLLECYFTRSFYKHILGKQVKYTDMESEDYSFYKGLVYLMEHDVADLGYDLTFSTEVQEFGVTNVRDLIPNGSKVPVNEHNKMEYIRLVCQMKMTVSIQKQLNAFLEGFYDIIPKRLIAIFNEQELELLISGLPNIDIDDLKNNTEYHKYQATSLQIQWFWRALRSFDQADRAKFLQFVTGTSKVPLQGFGSLEGMNGVQKFQIHRDDRSTDRLPSAHTCFNQLDLPVYETYDKLRLNLLKAIQECSEGFGFA